MTFINLILLASLARPEFVFLFMLLFLLLLLLFLIVYSSWDEVEPINKDFTVMARPHGLAYLHNNLFRRADTKWQNVVVQKVNNERT